MSKETPVRRRGSIGLAFNTFARSLRHGYDNLFTMMIMGLIWYLGALLLVPIGPLTAGMHRAIQPMTEERTTSWRTMIQGFRRDWGWSTRLVLCLVLGAVIIAANMNFYGASDQPILQYLGITFFVFLILWLCVAVLAFAMALRQHDLKVVRTLRNTIVMVGANMPGMVVSFILLGITSIIFFILPPLFILLPSWIALWGQEQTRLYLVQAGYIPPDEIADRVRGS